MDVALGLVTGAGGVAVGRVFGGGWAEGDEGVSDDAKKRRERAPTRTWR